MRSQTTDWRKWGIDDGQLACTGNAQAIRMNLGRLEGEQSRLAFDLTHIEKDCKYSLFAEAQS